MFESKHDALLPRREFLSRLVRTVALGVGFVLVSLGMGMVGYRELEGMGWLDAFLNSSMLLSGMGPLKAPETDGGKLFAGLYALYSGLAVITVAAILFAPIFHRAMHRFHVEDEGEPEASSDDRGAK
jgi:hypothetical protein